MVICGILFAVSGLLPPSQFILFVVLNGASALAGAFFNGPMMTIVQRRIAPKELGRVMALISALMSLSAPVGLVIAGPVADEIGVASWFVICGSILALISLAAFIPKSTRSLDDPVEEPG
jgi:DHA3 family macrolide efflux protein-like MFS transporter